MPRVETKRSENWGTGPGKTLDRIDRGKIHRLKRNQRRYERKQADALSKENR